jgi:CRP-like cAMP-binding protein
LNDAPKNNAFLEDMKPLSREVNGTRNRILSRLPSKDLQRLRRQMKLVELPLGTSLYEPNAPLERVYFPEDGLASLLTRLGDGIETEVATVGREGMVGMPAFFGVDSVPGRTIWQVPGKALMLQTKELRRETRQGGALNDILHLYAQGLFTLISQSASCNRRHEIVQRCSRWLLMTHDRVNGDEFALTQEFLSKMLGVRRAGVSVAAGILQKAGLIKYSRGRITIVDREGLEGISCECYGIVREEFDRLLG